MIYKQGTAFSLVLIFTALSFVGWFFVPLLSVSLQPSAVLPSFTVTSSWGNTSATIVEEQLTSKLEGAINTLEGVKKIGSASSSGRAKIEIEIDEFADFDKLRLEISSVIRRLFPKLPVGVSYPIIQLNSTNNEDVKPLMIFTLYGPHDSFVLQKYAENNIQTTLSLVSGIEKIIVYGGTAYQWQISYKPELISRLSISPGDIAHALEQYFHKQSLGFITENIDGLPEKKITVKLSSKQSDTIRWAIIPIKKTTNKILYLGNIAKVNKVKQEVSSYFRINGENAINIVVYPEKGSNALKLSETIMKEIEELRSDLPYAYVLNTSYNSTEYVSKELSKIYNRTALTLIILLVFVFIVSLSIRYVVLIILSLFTNISMSFILYYFFSIEIHLYSLAGITVSLGLIIDNSIVMADHLVHRKNLKVYTALMASTFTTMASLIIIWFLPGNLRFNLWDFALIIVVNLSVSLVVSLFYIPALLSMIPIKKTKYNSNSRKRRLIVLLSSYYSSSIIFLLRYRTVAFLLLILAFGLPIFMLPNQIHSKSMLPKIYNSTLGNEWYVDNLKPYVNKYLGGSFRLFSYYVFENSYYSEAEETKLQINAAMPKGATIDQLNDVFSEIETFVGQYRELINYHVRISSAQYAEMAITFKDESSENNFPDILKSKLITRSIDLGGVNWDIFGVGKGFSNRTGHNEMINFKVKMLGYNYDELETQALKLQNKLEKHPRVKKVNISGNKRWWSQEKSYEYLVNINTDKTDYWKINFIEIYSTLQNKSLQSGRRLGLFTLNTYDLINIVPENTLLNDKWEIMNQPIEHSNRKLSEFINIEKGLEQQTIYKENQNYLRIVDFQYIGSSKFGNKYLKKVLDEMKLELPIGYTTESTRGNFRLQKESISYTLLIIIITAIIFIICSILFESLLRPFAIILTVPASFIGVFLTFYLFDFNFDQGGYASFVMITGLVVNSAIYLLNELDNVTNKKRSLMQARMYVKAFNRKIVPIMLTIGSTVLGLVPFVVLGQNEPFWFALAVGTIGGLLFSILVIVFYLPLFILGKQKIIQD